MIKSGDNSLLIAQIEEERRRGIKAQWSTGESDEREDRKRRDE